MNRNQCTSLSDLNLSLLGRDSDLFKHGDKIRPFVKNLHTSQERLDIFPCWTEFFSSQENFDESLSATQVSLKAIWSCYMESLFISIGVDFGGSPVMCTPIIEQRPCIYHF